MARKRNRKRRAPRVPQQKRSQQKVEWLLDAAGALLAKEGYDAATTNRIAAKAGVNIATLYQFFPGKTEVIRMLAERHLKGVVESISAQIVEAQPLSVPVAVRTVIHTIFETFAQEEGLNRTLMQEVPRVELLNPAIAMRRQFVEVLTAAIGQRDDLKVRDPQLTAFVVVHSVNAMLESAVVEEPRLLRDPRYVEEVCRLVTRYLGVDEEAPVESKPTGRGVQAGEETVS